MRALLRSTVVLAVATSGCGSVQQTPTTDTWVGTLHEGDEDLSIALAVQDKRVAIYVCGDDPTRDDYPGWFIGDADGTGHITLTRSGWSIVATWADGLAEGTVTTPKGIATHWTGAPVRANELAGLYVALDSGCTTGVIVTTPPDRGPIARGAWCDAFGNRSQVTPDEPVQAIDGRLAVHVQLQTGLRRFEVSRVQLPLP